MADRLESAADLACAVEENAAEFLLALGRAGGGEERAEPQIQWVIGGSPIDYHNAVVRAELAVEQTDEAIVALLVGYKPMACREPGMLGHPCARPISARD